MLAIAAAAATIAGVATYALLSAGRDAEGFESLGWAFLGALVGLVLGTTVTIAGLIVLARRLFAPGNRVAPVVLALVGPFAPLALAALIAGILPSEPPPALISLLALTALLAPSLAFLWCGSGPSTRGLLLRGAGVLTAVAVVGSSVLYVVSDAREDEVVADLPLVLFDGTSADATFLGWKRDAFSTTVVREETAFSPEGHEAYLKYFAPGGVAFVTMRTDVGDCSPTLVRGYTCQVVGTLPAGELRSYRSTAAYATYPDSEEFLVLAYADGSGVSMNVDGADVLAQEVLSRLRRVDRRRFEDATDSELALRP